MTTFEAPRTATTTVPEPSTGFGDRVLDVILGAQELQAAYLGDRLGWYSALAEHGPLTSDQLADHTNTAERYAREWLEHQAACGWLAVDDPGAPPTRRRFSLPAEHAEVLTDADSLAGLMPLIRFVGAVGRRTDDLVEAYRTGGGVSWAQQGDEVRHAQADANRPVFLHALGQELLPQATDVHARLQEARRIADVGCGAGWSAVGLARTYRGVEVDGYDIDGPSIAMAEHNVAALAADVADRVQFHVADGAAVDRRGTYDAVFAFECIHDMADPVAVLAAMGELATEDGMVIVMDERTEHRFTPNAGPMERLFYGYSLTCCLPDGLATRPSVGTGTVMRPDTMARYAAQAGFSAVDELPIEHDVFRFYRLHR